LFESIPEFLKSDEVFIASNEADDIVAQALASRTWNESQKVALEVAHRRLKKAMDDMQKA